MATSIWSLLLVMTFGAMNFSSAQTVDFETWKASEDIRRNFTYYLSGYDQEDRPIWVGECGKWDVRKVVEQGPEKIKEWELYIDQALYRYNKSINLYPGANGEPKDGIVILDMEFYNNFQYAHGPTIQLLVKKARDVSYVANNMDQGYVINLNYIAQNLFELLKPVFGKSVERTEFFGTNKSRWIPQLLKKLPRSSLPEWYGGQKDYKPLKVYG